LVEVALAMGILAFALVALVGMMSVGLNAGRQANNDTQVATIARAALAEFMSSGYGALTDTVFFFDHSGKRVASEADAYFRCEFAVGEPPGRGGLPVTMTFKWPAMAVATGTAHEIAFPNIIAPY